MESEIKIQSTDETLRNASQYFQQVSKILSEFWWLLDFKWTHLFVDNILTNIPRDWNDFLDSFTHSQIYFMMKQMTIPPELSTNVPESFKKFLDDCRHLSLRLEWPMIESPAVVAMTHVKPSARKYQSPMKHRESESLAYFVKRLVESTELLDFHQRSRLTILDIGCGLGYISGKLNEEGFKVIGIEAQKDLVITASKRNTNVKYIQRMIDDSPENIQFLTHLLRDECGNDGKVLMIGLHTCGDLLSYMMNIYTEVDQIIGLACITCCYHKISAHAFPRSQLFSKIANDYCLKFNPVAMRVGCQCTPSKWAEDIENLPKHTLAAFSRSILEEMLVLKRISWNRIRCKLKLASTLPEYLDQILPGFDVDAQDGVINTWNSLLSTRSCQLNQVKNLKILQTLIQPVTETVILMDHCVRLCEMSLPSCVYQVYSQLISPRNTLLLSLKPSKSI